MLPELAWPVLGVDYFISLWHNMCWAVEVNLTPQPSTPLLFDCFSDVSLPTVGVVSSFTGLSLLGVAARSATAWVGRLVNAKLNISRFGSSIRWAECTGRHGIECPVF